jgi:hypothetical protein
MAGCLVVAGAVLAVPLGLAALALWWNWLGTMGTGGALAQVLFSFALCGLLLWLAWRGVVRPVWGAVWGRVRPRPNVSQDVPPETSPAPNVPSGTDAGPGTFPGHVGHVQGARDEGQSG